MNSKAQIIFNKGKPAFVVLPYDDYMALTGDKGKRMPGDDEFVPFMLNDYIKNPVRVMRIEAGLNQAKLAKRLGVTQGYISRIENRNYKASDTLLKRVRDALKGARK